MCFHFTNKDYIYECKLHGYSKSVYSLRDDRTTLTNVCTEGS